MVLDHLIHGGRDWVEVKQIALGARNTTISLAKPRSPKPTTINATSNSRWTKSSISLVVEEQDLLGDFQLHLPRLLVVKYAEIGDSDFLQRQREAHRQFQGCPQIIRCYGDECTALNNGRMIYSVLFEHASGGNLADLIKTYGGGGGLAELDVKSFAKSILLGLDCIHNKGYAHLDIKPKNILLVRDSTRKRKRGASAYASAGLIAKNGDFWIAKSPKQISRETFRGNERSYLEGTPRYMSPEVITENKKGPACDVWALGCVVVEMLCGQPAFSCRPGETLKDFLDRIGVGGELPRIPAGISKEAHDFLKRCFVGNSKSRWNAGRLLSHPFLKEDTSDAKAPKKVRYSKLK